MIQTINQLDPDPKLFAPAAMAKAFDEGQTIPYLKELLAKAKETLIERFDAGEGIKRIIARRAWLVDHVLRALWEQQSWPADVRCALVAVGGYGRGELNLHSDIDLLLLFQANHIEKSKATIEQLLTCLWDIGLEVGHSVRTLDECVDEASKDITIATNLMEARVISGDESLLDALNQKIGPDQIWPGKAFFAAKLEEQKARHEKHNNTEYNLEPNLKSAPGGLRDIQMVGWVAKRHFGCETLEDLVKNNFLTEKELSILESGQSFLWRVRFALHAITDRDENRLLFDHQRMVAARLGYTDSDANLAVEQFMQRYYRVALALSEFNDVLLQHFDEVILRQGEEEQVEKLNNRFQVRNGYIEVVNEQVFEHTPPALLEIFVLMSQNENIKGVRAQTIRLIRDHRHKIDEEFRQDIRNISLFIELLRAPYALSTQLRRMKRYGVLGQYIPSFGRVIGQMQYDLFHIYTVDAHTLLVIKNMRRFFRDDEREKFPIASRIIRQLPKVELLYLAGLYHDIAKGRGGDHSELGADEAREFCLHHRLSKWDANLVAWLVKNHLLMSVTAQKKDVSDPEVVLEFAQSVGDQIHLDYLYTLTVADIRATNPTLWNGWRASLMRQLYTETKRTLRRGLETAIDKQEWIDETRQQSLVLLRKDDIKLEDVEHIWQELGDDYFLRHSAHEIAWHGEGILRHKNNQAPLILVRDSDDRKYEGGTQIFVYTKDQPNLFAATVAAMDQLSLTILDARIMSSNTNFSLDTYIVIDEHGGELDDPQRIQQIKETLEATLSNPDQFPDIVEKRMPRKLKHFSVRTDATISNDIGLGVTVIEVRTLDRPGLLAQIGKVFKAFDLSITNARIATLGERAEDVFFVTDQAGNPISDPDLCLELRDRLRKELTNEEACDS